ncbi:hypothetical protein [Brevibacillus sp. AG162]|uniref:hypothetical protein n=1 Tax=Brevibacillus sp. AG162 TaxID=2572910 RepID=UPI00163A74C6|nr:hypothetical protein [Brevibacillus sp. AG162]
MLLFIVYLFVDEKLHELRQQVLNDMVGSNHSYSQQYLQGVGIYSIWRQDVPIRMHILGSSHER